MPTGAEVLDRGFGFIAGDDGADSIRAPGRSPQPRVGSRVSIRLPLTQGTAGARVRFSETASVARAKVASRRRWCPSSRSPSIPRAPPCAADRTRTTQDREGSLRTVAEEFLMLKTARLGSEEGRRPGGRRRRARRCRSGGLSSASVASRCSERLATHYFASTDAGYAGAGRSPLSRCADAATAVRGWDMGPRVETWGVFASLGHFPR